MWINFCFGKLFFKINKKEKKYKTKISFKMDRVKFKKSIEIKFKKKTFLNASLKIQSGNILKKNEANVLFIRLYFTEKFFIRVNIIRME